MKANMDLDADVKVVTVQKLVPAAAGAGLSKVLSFLGFSSWAELSAFLVTCYTLILIGEWVWKRFIRPWFVKTEKEPK